MRSEVSKKISKNRCNPGVNKKNIKRALFFTSFLLCLFLQNDQTEIAPLLSVF